MWEILGDSLIDLLDILIVAFLLYRLLLFIRGTRATQMFVGLGILLVLSFFANLLGMIVLRRVLNSLQTVWIVAFIIIFQPELRSALMYLGRRRLLNIFRTPDEIPEQDEILNSVKTLSRRGLGALIVIEREVGLGRWIRTGTQLSADISAPLLESIFTVPGPLHDGAVIISQGKIAAAGCILPLTEREELGYLLGMRHRAAIGLSEVSDAVVIVVSEETRAVSLSHRGEIRRGLSQDDLTTELNRIYTRPSDEKTLREEQERKTTPA